MVYKNYVVHPASATNPALAGCAAARQGKFDQMADLIWEKAYGKRDFGKDNLEKLAGELGLDMNRFKADMDGSCKQQIQKEQRELAKFGARGTPSFFINGRFIAGARPIGQFKTLIDEELKKAKERISKGTKLEDYYKTWVVEKGKKSI